MSAKLFYHWLKNTAVWIAANLELMVAFSVVFELF